MAQTIKHLRGLETNRAGQTPVEGELLITTDNYNEIFVGDGSTAGGNALAYLSTRLGGTVGGNVIISGDLTVNGTTTSINSNEVNIGDAVIVLNYDEAGTPSQNAGFEIERGTASNVSLLWNEGVDEWQLTDTAGTRRLLDTDDLGTGYTQGTGISISTGTITNTDLGSAQNIFKNVLSDAGTAVADSNNDTLSILGGTGIETSVTADALTIAITDNSVGATQLNVSGNGTGGQILSSDGDGSFSWVPAPSGTTNLTWTAATRTIASSTGSNAVITLATGSDAGLMSSSDFTKLGNISGTNTGDEAAASTTVAGIIELATTIETDAGSLTNRAVTPASLTNILSDISTNNAKVSNVTTNLSIGTATGTTLDINSSDGTNATIPAANTNDAGLMTSTQFDKLAGIADGATANVGTVTSVTAGAGMTQTGTSTVNPTLNVIANADASIVVNANDIQVGTVDGGNF